MSEELLQCRRFRVERVEKKLNDGSRHTREVIRHPGSVVILPLLSDQRVCLIRNYRVAVDQTLIELPAGTLEPGEPPIETAERELIEETGYRAGQLRELTSFFAAPGILDERMYLYLATDLTPGPAAREPGEQIENYVATREECRELLSRGAIRDAKTLIGLMWCDQFLV